MQHSLPSFSMAEYPSMEAEKSAGQEQAENGMREMLIEANEGKLKEEGR